MKTYKLLPGLLKQQRLLCSSCHPIVRILEGKIGCYQSSRPYLRIDVDLVWKIGQESLSSLHIFKYLKAAICYQGQLQEILFLYWQISYFVQIFRPIPSWSKMDSLYYAIQCSLNSEWINDSFLSMQSMKMFFWLWVFSSLLSCHRQSRIDIYWRWKRAIFKYL